MRIFADSIPRESAQIRVRFVENQLEYHRYQSPSGDTMRTNRVDALHEEFEGRAAQLPDSM